MHNNILEDTNVTYREDTTVTYRNLIRYLNKLEPTATKEEIHNKALEEIKKIGLQYYVSLMGFYELRDISCAAQVKIPAKYFNTYEAAKIFQLKSILAMYNREITKNNNTIKNVFTVNDVESMKKQYEDLIEEFPEYAI